MVELRMAGCTRSCKRATKTSLAWSLTKDSCPRRDTVISCGALMSAGPGKVTEASDDRRPCLWPGRRGRPVSAWTVGRERQ